MTFLTRLDQIVRGRFRSGSVNSRAIAKVVSRHLGSLALAIVLTVTLAPDAGHAQQSPPAFAGYVFEFRGSWRIGPQYASDVTLGQGILNHGSLKLISFQPDAYIRVGLIDKSVIGLNCREDATKCRGELAVAVNSLDDGLSARLKNVWNHLTAPPAQALVFTESRGAERPAPHDSVIPLTAGKPDLAAALKNLGPGKFEVTLQRVGGETSIPLQVDWNNSRASVSGPPVQPGLYILSYDAFTRPATVLVVAAERAKKLANDFEEAKRFANGWPPRMSHAFLTSVLAEFDRENNRAR